MGMFDIVDVLCPVEIPEYIEKEHLTYIKAAFDRNGFQTKDLNCLLDKYYIDENGVLRDSLERTHAI